MTCKILVTLAIILCSTKIYSQYQLETPDGKKVKLNADGTWVFLNNTTASKTGSGIPKTSTAKYASHLKKYTLWYDPNEWVYDTAKKGNSFTWDAYFYSMDRAITGYCLESRLSMPLENVEETVRQQWEGSGEIKSITSYKDTVNGLPLTVYEMQLAYGGLTYQYKGFIHSAARGSFQFVVGTQKEIYEEDKEKIELLLKGLARLQ